VNEPSVGVPTCYRHPGRETWIRCQRCERSICPDCMNEASVGFQCPECVAEGRKSVREARAPYGGKRSSNPGLTSLVLIVINAAVWIAVMATGGSASRQLDGLALRPNGFCLDGDQGFDTTRTLCEAGQSALWLPGVGDGAWWQLVTVMFMHVEPLHLGVNMLALWVLGPQLEAVLGRVRFLALYLLSGLTGSVAVYWLAQQYTPTVGASGAIFGLLGALLVVAIKVRGNVQGILLWLGINVAITFMPGLNISWQGHFGGLAGGALIAAILIFAPKERRTALQSAGLAVLALVLVVAVVVRTLTLQ
jgi:membrane associated rhomboid family serine protease